ncbi:MAG: polyprenyl synthetase family protein [Candidatus Micrarchaeia archaeon]
MDKGTIQEIKNFKEFAAYYKDKIFQILLNSFPSIEAKEFDQMVKSYTIRKGQYRRPAYLILWTLLYGGNVEDALVPAAAQQASEDYFLMHDDWMDGNGLRRGLPSAHKMYGEINAILAGDTVHAIAWNLAKTASDKLGDHRGSNYFAKFFDIMLQTHIGQYYDIHLTRDIKDISSFTKEDYYKSIKAKSAYYSVYGPMQCGAIIANADKASIENIKEYGIPAGNAFQIQDDILDCISTEENLGKNIGNDVREGVKTIILWHAVQNSDPVTLSRLKSIYSKRREEKSDEEVKWVLDKFVELGSIKFAQQEAERLTKESLEKFEKLSSDLPESQIKNIARDSISYTLSRNK